MKIAPLLILLYIALAGIMLIDGTLDPSSTTLNPYNVTSTDSDVPGANSTEQGALWNLFWNPTQWGSNGLVNLLVSALFLSTVAGIVTQLIVKSDITLLTPVFIALISAGVLPIIAIWNVINREIWGWMIEAGDCCSQTDINLGSVVNGVDCSAVTTCAPSTWISGLLIGPIAIMWIMACIEWLTARPMT